MSLFWAQRAGGVTPVFWEAGRFFKKKNFSGFSSFCKALKCLGCHPTAEIDYMDCALSFFFEGGGFFFNCPASCRYWIFFFFLRGVRQFFRRKNHFSRFSRRSRKPFCGRSSESSEGVAGGGGKDSRNRGGKKACQAVFPSGYHPTVSAAGPNGSLRICTLNCIPL